ncbi:MAG: DNA-binding protein [Defluviitaleaceae bacterium]|nr:DNA-binding protein [Defluviitaleaceae bacterium]
MEKLVENENLPNATQHKNLLYDFYGGMLTKRQCDVFLLRHTEDNSLTEISDIMGITPQAVVESLRNTSGKLDRYEEILGLVAKHERQNTALSEIKHELENIEVKSCPPEILSLLMKTLKLIDDLI